MPSTPPVVLPTPRSFQSILGGLIDDYLQRLDDTGIAPGVDSLRPGSSIFALLEAVAQSQAHNSQDIMNLTDVGDIDRAKGQRLDWIGEEERLPRRAETYARGYVTISDPSFQRVSTRIYSGKPAPIPQSTVVYVTNAAAWPADGQVYIGRGTENYEGPLTYVGTPTQVGGSYWVINLAVGTLKYHNQTDEVLLAQGGDRVIEAGTVVGTPQGNSLQSVSFTTTERTTILDGEVEITNVPVMAQESGQGGNVSAGAIRYVPSPAFVGMTVTNPNPIQNGLTIEDDDHYRERIKSARANRSRATIGAIMSRVYGIRSVDENATVISASLVDYPSRGPVLYIDDGNGYEERDEGIDYEALTSCANGGETVFHLTYGRPVAKATVKTRRAAPYQLVAGATISVVVGGTLYSHSFTASEFRAIDNATAYEVVASINANPTLGFSARTFDGGTKFGIFARSEANDDLQVVAAEAAVDAAPLLYLPTEHIHTLYLYRNDELLYKDGLAASVWTANKSLWGTITSGETLVLDVDGTGYRAYAITDTDFVNTQLGYTQVSASNSLESWAAVLNAKITGVTASVEGGSLKLVSNKGRSNLASLSISSTSTLVQKGMFVSTALAATGKNSDYVLDRNLGIVELLTPLTAGDVLTAGTAGTRAYLESAAITTVTPPSAAVLTFAIDGGATTVSTGMISTITVTRTLVANGAYQANRFTATYPSSAPAYPFLALKQGDWVVSTLSLAVAPALYAMRISVVDPAGGWFETDASDGATVFAHNNLTFVRSNTAPQTVVVPGAVQYTAQSLVALFNAQLTGATATAIRSRLRITTDTHNTDGDIALIQQNAAATGIGFLLATVQNDQPHYATVQSGNSETGTPVTFDVLEVGTVNSISSFDIAPTWDQSERLKHGQTAGLTWLRSPASTRDRFGTNAYQDLGIKTFVLSSFPNSVTTDSAAALPTSYDTFVLTNRFMLGAETTLDVVVDDNPAEKGASIPMFRRLTPDVRTSWGHTMKFLDADNPDDLGVAQPLGKAFGSSFDFDNFVLYAPARAQTHWSDPTRKITWRLRDYWNAYAGYPKYVLPAAAAQTLSVVVDEPSYDVLVSLPSGAARTFVPQPGQSKALIDYVPNIAPDQPAQVFVAVGWTGLTFQRTNNIVTCTPTKPAWLTETMSGSPWHGVTLWGTIAIHNSAFPAADGDKLVLSVTNTTFTYEDFGADFGPVLQNAATISFLPFALGEDGFTQSANPVQVGDVIHFDGTIVNRPNIPAGSWTVLEVTNSILKFYKV